MKLKKEVVLIFAVLILSQIAYSAVVTQTGDTLDNPARVDFPPVYDEGPPEDALKAGATSVFTPDSIFVNNRDTNEVTLKAQDRPETLEFKNVKSVDYGEKKDLPNGNK